MSSRSLWLALLVPLALAPLWPSGAQSAVLEGRAADDADAIEPLDLPALKGKVVVVEVMETWCGACKTAIPTLNDWHQKLADKGLHVVAASPESADSLRRYREAQGFKAYLSVDVDAAVKKRFEVEAFPTFLVLDREGELRGRFRGAGENLAKVEGVFQALLEAPAIPDGITFGVPQD